MAAGYPTAIAGLAHEVFFFLFFREKKHTHTIIDRQYRRDIDRWKTILRISFGWSCLSDEEVLC